MTSTKKQKMAISRSIVDAVRSMNPPGRFLDKDPDTGLWNDIGDRKAIEKTSQALRDGAADLRKQLSEDLGDPDFLNAVFEDEMDVSTSSTHTMISETSQGDTPMPPPAPPAPVPSKAKDQHSRSTQKKGHRRTRSNPNTLAEKKKVVAAKRRKPELEESVPKPVLSHFHSADSSVHPPSPMMNHYSSIDRAASFDYAYHHHHHQQQHYSAPHTPRSPPSHPGMHYPHYSSPAGGGPSLKCASFDTAHTWAHHGASSSSVGGYLPPRSPASMPGGSGGHSHHQTGVSPAPVYSRAPPVSPVRHSWSSPRGYGPSSPPFRASWRTSPSPYAYPPGDLSVPTLGRDTSDSSVPRVPLSPVRPLPTGTQGNSGYQPPPPILRASSAEDFIPPLSPGSYVKPKQEKIIVAKPIKEESATMVDDDDDKVDGDKDASYSPTCTLFGGCFFMDVEDKTDVEVVLSGDDERIEVNPASNNNREDGNGKTLSPLPFLRKEVETPTSFLETLLQLPIAPCAPQDVE